jgi:hypothetical protein
MGLTEIDAGKTIMAHGDIFIFMAVTAQNTVILLGSPPIQAALSNSVCIIFLRLHFITILGLKPTFQTYPNKKI